MSQQDHREQEKKFDEILDIVLALARGDKKLQVTDDYVMSNGIITKKTTSYRIVDAQ